MYVLSLNYHKRKQSSSHSDDSPQNQSLLQKKFSSISIQYMECAKCRAVRRRPFHCLGVCVFTFHSLRVIGCSNESQGSNLSARINIRFQCPTCIAILQSIPFSNKNSTRIPTLTLEFISFSTWNLPIISCYGINSK